MAETTDLILRMNPWWIGKRIEKINGLKHRFIFKDLERYLHTRQIIALIGLRRTGKTILMYQLIDKLLENGIEPKNILYFSFDEILAKDPQIIQQILSIYEKEILRRELKNVYIFFDEVQYIQNWQAILKRYYDLIMGIKFIVSGSSSPHVKVGVESLAGRIYEFEIKPLTFKEFLYLRGFEVKDILLQKIDLERLFYKYIIHGGLPEIIFEEDFEKVKRYVNSIIEKIIFIDIPKAFDIENPFTLREIIKILSEKPGILVDYNTLASTLNISRTTASKYIKYLEQAFMIKLLANYRGSEYAIARKAKKVYFTSHTLLIPSFEDEEELLKSINFIVENIIVNQLDAKFFWRNRLGEVDIIHKKIPVEIKFGEKVNKKDLKNIIRFQRGYGNDKAIIITKDIEREEVIENIKVTCIPIIKFLLEYV
ncbi:MAG: ATP-binding protein [Candidatus Methanomethylicia archaeon]